MEHETEEKDKSEGEKEVSLTRVWTPQLGFSETPYDAHIQVSR